MCGSAADLVLERRQHGRVRRLQRGKQAEDHRRHDRDGEREQQHPAVHDELEADREGGRRHQAREHVPAPVRHEHADPAGQQAEDGALGEQLPDQTPTVGAERDAQPDLAAPRDGPRQEQIGHVGAGDEQHQAGHAEQRHQDRFEERRGPLIGERLDVRAVTRVVVPGLDRDALGHGVQLLARLAEGPSRAQAADAVHELVLPSVQAGEAGQHRHQRHGRVGVELEADDRPAEPRRGHPDHREIVAAELQVPADDRRITREAAPPEGVPEDHHGRAFVLVALRQQAAQRRPHAQHVEVVARRHLGPGALDRPALAPQAELPDGRRGDVERPRLGAPVAQAGVRQRPRPAALRVRVDGDDPAEVRHGRQRPQHERVHPREHRRVGAEAQPQRDDGDQREAGTLAERADREP